MIGRFLYVLVASIIIGWVGQFSTGLWFLLIIGTYVLIAEISVRESENDRGHR